MKYVKRNCCVCGLDDVSEGYRQHYPSIAGLGDINYLQRVVVCKNCGFAFNLHVPSEKDLSDYYSMLSNYENPQRAGKESIEMLNKWNRTYSFIERRFSSRSNKKLGKRKALEIGCATGTGLSVFKSESYDVLGVDPSQKAVELALKLYDVKVLPGSFNARELKQYSPFDVIIFSHVIEHLLYPQQTVSDLKNILSSDGLVYIEVPNLLRPFVPMGYFTFEHLNYFTPTTLAKLMKTNGFCLDHMELFDNSETIEPFYPVIAASYGLQEGAQQTRDLDNDYEAAYNAIRSYGESSAKEIANLRKIIDKVLKRVEKGRLAIWGAGIHTSQLLSFTDLSKEMIACIFDNDPKKHGQMLNGIIIAGLGQAEDVKKDIDAIIISSKASENEIFEQIKYLMDYGIEVYKLYE